MHIGVFVDVHNGVPEEDGLGLLAKAAGLNADVSAIVCGSDIQAAAVEAANYGAQRVLMLDAPGFSEPVFTPRLEALTQVVARYSLDALLLSTTVMSVELAAALAARLEAGISWGMTELHLEDAQLAAQRPVINDSLLAEIIWTTAFKIGLFRPRAFAPVLSEGAVSSIESVDIDLSMTAQQPRLIEHSVFSSDTGQSLKTAEIVVSAGRGIGKKENFELIKELASVLGGVAGASLPVVEMGWAPRALQVGQTGTVVKPLLYIACGISGQIQHRIGIDKSGTIIAINKDPAAPIMNFSDLFVVAELENVLPRLIELLRQQSGSQCAG